MRVFYRVRRHKLPTCPPPVVYETARPVQWCCARMCQWWERLVGFGVRDCLASTDRGVNLYFDRSQANGTVAVEIVPIDHCPFCGVPVETCRVK
jgi:hypothetical protein